MIKWGSSWWSWLQGFSKVTNTPGTQKMQNKNWGRRCKNWKDIWLCICRWGRRVRRRFRGLWRRRPWFRCMWRNFRRGVRGSGNRLGCWSRRILWFRAGWRDMRGRFVRIERGSNWWNQRFIWLKCKKMLLEIKRNKLNGIMKK